MRLCQEEGPRVSAPLERASSGTFRREGRLVGGQYFSGRDTEGRTDRRRPRPEMSHLLCVEDEREEGEVGRQQLSAPHDAGDLKSKERCEL